MTVPTPDQVAGELSQSELDEPTTVVGERWPRFVTGGPDQVRATLEQMMEQSGADELMVQDLIAEPTARWRSRELLARMFDLASDPQGA